MDAQLATGGDVLSPGTLVALADGGAVLIGRSEWAKHEGEDTRSFRFNGSTGRWREIGTPWLAGWENRPFRSYESPGPRWLGSAVVKLADGRVLIAGGNRGGMETEGGAVRAARLYDPGTDTWTNLPRLPRGWDGGSGVLLADGSVLIVSGGREFLRFIP